MDVTIACVCPRKADGSARHERDTVTLRDKLGFLEATSIRQNIGWAKHDDPDATEGDLQAVLVVNYILQGVSAWSVQGVDDKGRPFALPVTKPNIREVLLSDAVLAADLADAADGLYREAIIGPLVAGAQSSLPPSPTDEPTSAKTPGSQKPLKPSKPSSTTTIQTGGTATITSLHDGVSTSSPSSASVT